MKILELARNKKLFLLIIAINPLFDMIYTITSKYLNFGYGQFSVSQIFRILFLLILILNIKKFKTFIKIVLIGFLLLIGLIVQNLLGYSLNFITDANLIFKIIYTFSVVVVTHEMLISNRVTKNELFKVLIVASIIICISIVISPLGLGEKAYSYDRFGYKGLFNYTNFISGCLLSIFPLLFTIECSKKVKTGLIVLVFSSLLLLGGKASMFGGLGCAFIMFIYYIVNYYRTKLSPINKKRMTILILTIIIVFLSVGFIVVKNEIDYMVANNFSFITYFTSHRNLQIEYLVDFYKLVPNLFLTILFGVGSSRASAIINARISSFYTIEQDFVGVVFYFGLIAFSVLCFFIITLIVKTIRLLKEDFKKYFPLCLSFYILIVQSILVGHVLYTALTGLFFGIITAIIMYKSNQLIKQTNAINLTKENNKTESDTELISIIVPVYNVENFLDICITSILNQTYRNFELLLINDGSTDSSQMICEKYCEKDFRVKLINKPNGGLSSARNEGINHAKGEYITFIDSDDHVSENYLNVLYFSLKRANSDLSIGAYCRFDEDNNISYDISITNDFLCDNITALKLLFIQKAISVSSCAKLYRRELFGDIRFPINKLYEDINTVPYLIEKAKSISYSSEIIYFYRIRKNSITNAEFKIKDMDLIYNTLEIKDYFDERYPITKKASNSYVFSKACNLFIRINSSNKINKNYFNYSWNLIKKYRMSQLTYSKTRSMNKIAALLSLFGYRVFLLAYKTKH